MLIKPFIIENDIEWAELDLFGHVNNVAFFFYVQKARLKFCEYLGLTSLNESGKNGFIVASSHCDFLQPLFYPGKVQLIVNVEAVNNSSFVLTYQIINQQQVIAAKAKDVLVVFDYQNRKKVLMDASIKEKLKVYQL